MDLSSSCAARGAELRFGASGLGFGEIHKGFTMVYMAYKNCLNCLLTLIGLCARVAFEVVWGHSQFTC